jgi:hypothetical protein
MRTSGQVTVHVEAPPEAVYDLVADVTRIGEFSPECRRAEWSTTPDGRPPAAGSGAGTSQQAVALLADLRGAHRQRRSRVLVPHGARPDEARLDRVVLPLPARR